MPSTYAHYLFGEQVLGRLSARTGNYMISGCTVLIFYFTIIL